MPDEVGANTSERGGQPTSPRSLNWRTWLLALVGLHLLVSIRYPWEEATYFGAVLRPNTDLFVLLATGLAIVTLLRLRLLPALVMTAAIAIIPIFRAGSTLVPHLYGKPLVVYNDVMMLPGLVHIASLHLSTLERVLWTGGLLLATALALLAIYRLARVLLTLAPSTGSRRPNASQWIVFVIAGILISVPVRERSDLITQPSVLIGVAREFDQTLLEWRLHEEFESSLPDLSQQREATPSNLARLEGADVYVLFVESYGRSLFRKPERRIALEALTDELQTKLDEAGFYSCSSFATSAVYGGSSSLAHAQFLSGAAIRSKHYFASLLASEIKPLPHLFNATGYRTLNVQPATTAEWPEGKYFGFQEDIFNDRFGYTGHTYHWGFMPDQFALAHLLSNELASSGKPVFLQYVSVTSHAPFSMVPPYFDDWSEVLKSSAFNRYPEKSYPIDVFNYTGHPEAEAAYVDTIDYSLKTMIGFACQLERPSLVIVLGDHQPPGIGDLAKYDKSFDVPIHVLSNRVELLLPFGKSGFQPGFIPADDYEAFELSLLSPALVASFSEPGAPPASDQ